MFERFTKEARQAVMAAVEEARQRQVDSVRTEHVLAALFDAPDNLAVHVLGLHGIDRDVVRDEIDRLAPVPSERDPDRGPAEGERPFLDADALSTLGIDLDEVRRQAEEAFGPGALDRTHAARGHGKGRGRWGHIPFDRTSKKTLELALRETLHLKHPSIGAEHILLGLLHTETGAAHHVLTAHGMTLNATRAMVDKLARSQPGAA